MAEIQIGPEVNELHLDEESETEEWPAQQESNL